MKKKIIISITALLTLSVLIFLYLQGRTDTFIYYETSTNLPTLEEYKEIGCEGFPELQNFNLIQVNRLKNFNISTGFVLSFEDYKSKNEADEYMHQIFEWASNNFEVLGTVEMGAANHKYYFHEASKEEKNFIDERETFKYISIYAKVPSRLPFRSEKGYYLKIEYFYTYGQVYKNSQDPLISSLSIDYDEWAVN